MHSDCIRGNCLQPVQRETPVAFSHDGFVACRFPRCTHDPNYSSALILYRTLVQSLGAFAPIVATLVRGT